jgi:hypothetical protein
MWISKKEMNETEMLRRRAKIHTYPTSLWIKKESRKKIPSMSKGDLSVQTNPDITKIASDFRREHLDCCGRANSGRSAIPQAMLLPGLGRRP